MGGVKSQVSWLLLLASLAHLPSCGCGGELVPTESPVSKAFPLANSGPATSELGEACQGPGGCKTSLCFRHAPGRSVCSIHCESDFDCPATWRCLPAMNTYFCVPGASWVPAQATATTRPLTSIAERAAASGSKRTSVDGGGDENEQDVRSDGGGF